MTDIEIGKNIIETEIQGLRDLLDNIGDDFCQAVDLLNQTSGKVIVCGLGKSGHIARKIAATFASTGTSSFYVHPCEAAHGDLGMISQQDVVINVSKSGETVDFEPLLAYCKRYEIPMISITSDHNSTLAQAATVSLLLPKSQEACPMGLAPTTSTTQTLVLGDALAVAAFKRTSFSSTDFKVFHPGGALGHRLRRVCEIMHTGDELPSVDLDMSMREAIIEMTSKRFGVVAVTEGNQLVGVITDGDVRRSVDSDILTTPVREIMTPDPCTIDNAAMLEEAILVMNEREITSLFVTSAGDLVGIIHIHDLLRAGTH